MEKGRGQGMTRGGTRKVGDAARLRRVDLTLRDLHKI